MAASSVTGIGLGSAEGPYRGYDFDTAHRKGLVDFTGSGSSGSVAPVTFHEPLPLTFFTKNQQDPPSEESVNNLAYWAFTLNTDHVHGVLRVPSHFTANFKPHIHWTKSQNTNQSGKTVQWKWSYTLFTSNGTDVTVSNTDVLTDVDTYDDTGTTNRVVYTAGWPVFPTRLLRPEST